MKTSVFVGTSLDGFIARENDGLDFLPDDPGEGHGYQEFYDTVDVMIIGRRLYDVALGFGTWPYGAKPVFVLSTNERRRPKGRWSSGCRERRPRFWRRLKAEGFSTRTSTAASRSSAF